MGGGGKLEEIAAERKLATSTIENHLAHYVINGEIAIQELVADEKLALITEYFTDVDDSSLGAAREVLGDEYSYAELRLVRNYLENLKNTKTASQY